jgi:hypothetical protein
MVYLIHCKNFYKGCNVPLFSTTIKKKIVRKGSGDDHKITYRILTRRILKHEN